MTENNFSFLRIAFLVLHFYSLVHFSFLARDCSTSTNGSSGLYKRIQCCLPDAILKGEIQCCLPNAILKGEIQYCLPNAILKGEIQYCLPNAILKGESRETIFPERLPHAPCKPYLLRCHDCHYHGEGCGAWRGSVSCWWWLQKRWGVWESVLGLEISKICAFLPSLPSISVILNDLLTTLDFGVKLHFSWIHELYFALKISLIFSNKSQPLLWDSYLFIFNWRTIALQYWFRFCHVSMWINHRCTCVPSLLNPPSHLPLFPTPLGCYRALVWFPWVI